MAKGKNINAQSAASAICDVGQAVRALRALGGAFENNVTGETLAICIKTMTPEMLRAIDHALNALDHPLLGGFSEEVHHV